jgi:hypothetical protein
VTAVIDEGAPAAAAAPPHVVTYPPGWPPLRGPVMPLPLVAPEPPPAPPQRRPRLSLSLSVPRLRLRWPDGDSQITAVLILSILVVATCAAVVSYGHAYQLARGHHESGIDARLLPVSIDGEILASSLVMLSRARRNVRQHWLARVNLIASITATIAVNAVVALPQQWIGADASVVIGAVLSAWPGQALVAIVEMGIRLVRDVREARDSNARRDSGTEDDRNSDSGQDRHGDSGGGQDRHGDSDSGGAGKGAGRRRKPATGARRRPAHNSKHDVVDAAIRKVPGWRTAKVDTATVAAAAGASQRTVERRLSVLRKEGGG